MVVLYKQRPKQKHPESHRFQLTMVDNEEKGEEKRKSRERSAATKITSRKKKSEENRVRES